MHEREQLSGPQESHGFLLHLLFIRRYRFHTYLPCLPCSPLQDMSAKHRGVKGKICYNLDYGRFNESGFLPFTESKVEIHLDFFFHYYIKPKTKTDERDSKNPRFISRVHPALTKPLFIHMIILGNQITRIKGRLAVTREKGKSVTHIISSGR